MRMKIFGLFAVLLLAGSLVAAGDHEKGNGAKMRILAHGNIEKLLKQGCSERALELRTAKSLECPENADLSGSDASEDVEVFAMDLNAGKQIRANLVWSNYTGAGRVIAVLDTGINYNHTELASSYVGGKDFVNNDLDPFDDNGHGTHVSGIITADGVYAPAMGVAPNAGILAGKVLGASGSGSISNIIAAIYWAADDLSVDAISMSLGTSKTFKGNCDGYIPDLTTAINYAVSKGKAVVAAAGNSHGGVSSPGCISSTIVVGAVDSSDRIASFSGKGSSMKDHGVVAPGVSILSTWLRASYAYASGTSMATPMVSATIALMKQKNSTLDVNGIKRILWATSKDLGGSGYDNTYGHGRIDAFAAVGAS